MKHINYIYLTIMAAALIVSCENGTIPETGGDTGGGSISLGTEIFDSEFGISGDSRSFSSFNGPPGAGIGSFDIQGGNSHLNNITSFIEVDDVNEYVPEIEYSYSGRTSGEISASTGLHARTELSAAGFGAVEEYSEYNISSLISHQVYFKAISDDPDTTRISLSAEISFSGHLEYTRENDHLDVSSSMGMEIWLQTMGWRNGELGLEYVALGPILFNEEGGAIVGYRGSDEGAIQSCCRDWFLGQIQPASTSGNVSVTETATAEIEPDSIKQLYITIGAGSSFNFIGMGQEFESSGTSMAEVESVNWSFSAFDPDNPDADIEIIYYLPSDNP